MKTMAHRGPSSERRATPTTAVPARGAADDVRAEAAFERWSAAQLDAVESALDACVPASAPAGLGDAMRYGVLGGGKRLRPLLVLATAHAVHGDRAASLRAACAVELIHAYSLVHDDLPCMDDDVLRRGKPTVHVRYGVAQAMLAGDAMQALAFEVLTPEDDSIATALQARLCGLLSRAAGGAGMAGGQAIDLASVGRPLDEAALSDMHRRKTGALLRASVLMGAACGTTAPSQWQALSGYGDAIGLAFQVVDDILDVTQASATLGKTAGKDEDANKPTYVSILGLDAARRRAHDLCAAANAALDASTLVDVQHLRTLADRVVQRDS